MDLLIHVHETSSGCFLSPSVQYFICCSTQTETNSDDFILQTQCSPPNPGWAEWSLCVCVRSSEQARPPRAPQQRRIQSQISLCMLLKEPNKPDISFSVMTMHDQAPTKKKEKLKMNSMRKIKTYVLAILQDIWPSDNGPLWMTCFCRQSAMSQPTSEICFYL